MSIPSSVFSRMYSESVIGWVVGFGGYVSGTIIERMYLYVKGGKSELGFV